MDIPWKTTISRAAMFAIPAISFPAGAQNAGTGSDSSVSFASTDSAPALRTSTLVLVTSEAVDQVRSDQLLKGVRPGQSLLLRSASSLTASAVSPGRVWDAAVLSPQLLFVYNTAMPFSQNNGSLWAGRLASSRTLLGFEFATPHARLIFAPEIIASANGDWILRHDYYAPPLPPGNDGRGYALPYYFWTFPIDQPMRFGDDRIRRFDLGESTVMFDTGRLQVGVSNENEWWGPGIRNAIVLSNNAPGFPHLFARTGAPIKTRLGAVELRWLVGGLRESRYFDTVSTNNLRSLASMAATLQTAWDPNLTVGFARSVYATADEWGQIPRRWFDVFARTYRYNRTLPRPIQDSVTARGGRDQILTLFGRWVFPDDGAELYAEWGRTQLPKSLRDFLTAPNHTQGYTLGLQWRGAAWRSGTVRFQGEVTQLEQSATFRDRPIGSWYTSPRAIQGYTNRGEIIGASIGPGASSQWLAMDYMRDRWSVGAFAGRIRWNEDVHSTSGLPIYVAYCDHDLSVYPGVRGAVSGRLGSISAEFSLQNRLNAFFQNGGGCPNNGARLDIRNNTLSLTLTSFDPRRWFPGS